MLYRYRSLALFLIAATLGGSSAVTTLCAEDNNWNPGNRNDNNWFTSGLWSLGRLPTLEDRVFIQNGYRSSFFTRTELSGADGYAGELRIAGGGRSNGPSLYVSNATLRIGTLLTLGDIGGNNPNNSGSLLIEGANAAVIGSAGARLVVGGAGNATLSIESGAKARFDGGTVIGRDVSSIGFLSIYDSGYPSRQRSVLETAFIERGNTIYDDVALRVNGGMIRATQNEDRFLRNFTQGTILISNNGFYFDTNGFDVTIGDGAHFEGVAAFNKVGEGTLTLRVMSHQSYGYNFSGGLTRFQGGVHQGHWGSMVLGMESGVRTSVIIEEQAVFDYGSTRLGLYSGQHGDLTIRDGSHVKLASTQGSNTGVTIGGWGDARLGLESGGHLQVNDSLLGDGFGWILIAESSGSTGTLEFGSSDLDNLTTTGRLSAGLIAFGLGTGAIRFNQTDTLILDADITGRGYVGQHGTGRTVMTGKIGSSVMTYVSQGTLVADGEFENFISLQDEGRLEGTGTLNVVYFSGGTLAPGNSGGVMEIGFLQWLREGIIEFDLGPTPEESDFLQVDELMLLGKQDGYEWTFVDNGWQVGETYDLMTLSTGILDPSVFTFTNGGGFDGEFSVEGNTLRFTIHAIPEPSMVALILACGVFALMCRSRKR